MMLAEGFCGFADLALAREEHEDVSPSIRSGARRLACSGVCWLRAREELVDGAEDTVELVDIFLLVFGLGFERAIAHLDGIGSPGNFQHRRVVEMPAEALRVNRRAGDDQL